MTNFRRPAVICGAMLTVPFVAVMVFSAGKPTPPPTPDPTTAKPVPAVAADPLPAVAPQLTSVAVARPASTVEPPPSTIAQRRDVAASLAGVDKSSPTRSGSALPERPTRLDLSFLAAAKQDPNDVPP